MIIFSYMLVSNKAVTGKYFVMTSINRNHVRVSGQGDTTQWACLWPTQTTANLTAMKLNWIIYIHICKYDIVIKPYNIWDSISPHTTEFIMQNYPYGHWYLRIHTNDFVIEIFVLRQFNTSSPGQSLLSKSHYLNQCWPDALTHTCHTRGRWVKAKSNISKSASNCIRRVPIRLMSARMTN